MFSRSSWCLTEITWSSKSPLLSPRTAFRPMRVRGGFHQRSRTRLEPDPIQNSMIDIGPLHMSSLVKPFVFAVGFSTLSVGGCAIWQYERLRHHAAQYLRKPVTWFSGLQKKTPEPVKKWWANLRDNEKVFYPILAINLLVFGAWRVRSFQPFMVKYFCSNPASRTVSLPMLLSTFSHYATLHLAANMYVLYSFMPAAVATLGKEQFVAMYLSGGVLSSFASYLYKAVSNQPGLSLGASGAIMAVLAYVCVEYPDTQLSIIFLPFYTFAAGTAIKAIMGLDLAGVVMGWKFFDHAAHLGGALFGIGWCYWGGQHVWGNRDKLQQYWHSLREGSPTR